MMVDLEVDGRAAVVIGGGETALIRVAALLAAGAHVTVVADVLVHSLLDLVQRGLITWVRRTFEPADVRSAALVVAATGGGDDDAVLAAARAERSLGMRAGAASRPSQGTRGEVVLVGGGPGDPGLLTIAGLAAIREADVIVCDRLAPLAVLAEAAPTAEIIDVGKIPRGVFTPQERINEILLDRARAGLRVARLKGGDSFVFGRGGEEWQACSQGGVPVTVIPGVSSATAAPALAGIPVTHRELTQGFTVVSGHVPPGAPASTLDWGALARTGTTLVVLMGVATLGQIATVLIDEGMDPGTPAAAVAHAGQPTMRAVRASLCDIASRSAEGGITAPAVAVIGSVAGLDLGAPAK